MKTKTLAILALAILTMLSLEPGFVKAAVPMIPDGYSAGRPDAKYGTYGTVVQASARAYQDRVVDLQNKSFGLAKMATNDPIDQAKAAFLLENQLIRLDLDIANAPEGLMTDFERQALLYKTVRAYKTTRTESERVYEDMIRFIDVQIPGPNGQQIRSEVPGKTESLYATNYRSDLDLSPAETLALYNKMVDAFQKKGGSLSEIKTLDPNLIKGLGAYTRVEYVQTSDGAIRVTEGKAGHVLLAEGQRVKTAGQIIFVKDEKGDVILMIVSNSSGNYKPDILSTELFSENLQKLANVSKMYTVITEGEPVSTQAVKIYLKGRKQNPTAIDSQLTELEKEGNSLLFPSYAGDCATVFSN